MYNGGDNSRGFGGAPYVVLAMIFSLFAAYDLAVGDYLLALGNAIMAGTEILWAIGNSNKVPEHTQLAASYAGTATGIIAAIIMIVGLVTG